MVLKSVQVFTVDVPGDLTGPAGRSEIDANVFARFAQVVIRESSAEFIPDRFIVRCNDDDRSLGATSRGVLLRSEENRPDQDNKESGYERKLLHGRSTITSSTFALA